MKKAINLIAFALGLVIGIAGLATGETRLIPAVGLSEGAADGLYVNVTGDTVTGSLAVDGNTTLGDAADDNVDSNAARWSWPNASTFLFGNTIVLDALAKGATCKGNWLFANDVQHYGDTSIGNSAGDDIFIDAGTLWFLRALTHNVAGNWNLDATGFQLSWIVDQMSLTGPFLLAGNLTVTGDTAIGNTAGDTMTGVGIWDLTGAASIAIRDPIAATHATNRQFNDARYQTLGSSKAGTVAGATFAGNPKIFTVTFNTAFPDANYAVAISAEDNRTFTFQTKLAGSFVMNSNANLALVGDVDWTATAHSDP